MATAILIDAAFFLKRYRNLFGEQPTNPARVADSLFRVAMLHLKDDPRPKRDLYRLFVYDCPPLSKKAHLPISKRAIDFSKTDVAKFRLAFHEKLKTKRKIALRLGELSDAGHWQLRPNALKSVLTGQADFNRLIDDDFTYEVRQKGVDMKIGIDIAHLSIKQFVDQIILVSGDADFVPAAKLARREGIDFILDPLWQPIMPGLREHVDGISSVIRSHKTKAKAAN